MKIAVHTQDCVNYSTGTLDRSSQNGFRFPMMINNEDIDKPWFKVNIWSPSCKKLHVRRPKNSGVLKLKFCFKRFENCHKTL